MIIKELDDFVTNKKLLEERKDAAESGQKKAKKDCNDTFRKGKISQLVSTISPAIHARIHICKFELGRVKGFLFCQWLLSFFEGIFKLSFIALPW